MKNETPEQFVEAMSFANQSIPLSPTSEPNTCGNEYAALTGSPYAPRFKEQAYVAEINQLLARVAELEAILRRVDVYFQHTGKVGDLPVSVHALLPKLIHRHEDGTETAVTPLPMWQP